jgi:hypothetical protein
VPGRNIVVVPQKRSDEMRNEEPTRTDPPPVLTGDLEADAAASLGWLRAHPERWLEDRVEDHRELGGVA